MRKENFGAILYCGIKYWVSVDFDFLYFYENYHEQEFTPTILANFLRISNEEVLKLIKYLLKRKILYKK